MFKISLFWIVTLLFSILNQSASQLNFGYGGGYPNYPGRDYSVGYGYVSAGYGSGFNGLHPQGPQFGVAKVQVQKNPVSYQYSVQESGPYYQKYHHQTGSSVPVGIRGGPIIGSPSSVPISAPGGLYGQVYGQGYGYGGSGGHGQILPIHRRPYDAQFNLPLHGQYSQIPQTIIPQRQGLPFNGQGFINQGQGIPFNVQRPEIIGQGQGIPFNVQRPGIISQGQGIPFNVQRPGIIGQGQGIPFNVQRPGIIGQGQGILIQGQGINQGQIPLQFQQQQQSLVGNIPIQEQALALHGQSLPLHAQNGVPTYGPGTFAASAQTYPFGRSGLSPGHYGNSGGQGAY